MSRNLWNKYGCKTISVKKAQKDAQGGTVAITVKRSYYKCFLSGCLAKLTVDAEPLTNQKLKITSSGTHNHPIDLAWPKKDSVAVELNDDHNGKLMKEEEMPTLMTVCP